MPDLTPGTQAALKWVAIITMAIDHLAVAFAGGDLYVFMRLVGRVAYPLFAFLLAYNLVAREVPVQRYLRPLAIGAVVSQVPYIVLFESLGLNIFVPLLVGALLVHLALAAAGEVKPVAGWLLTGLAACAGVFVCALWADYGLAGALLPLAWALVVRNPVPLTVLGLTGALVLLNWGWMGALVPLVVPGVIWAAVALDATAPRGHGGWPMRSTRCTWRRLGPSDYLRDGLRR